MLARVLLAFTVALAPNSTLYSDARAPDRFRAPQRFEVVMLPVRLMNSACSDMFGSPPPSGMTFMACAAGNTAFMPNPCEYPDSDDYAHLLCHEQAHLQGWPATHGD